MPVSYEIQHLEPLLPLLRYAYSLKYEDKPEYNFIKK